MQSADPVDLKKLRTEFINSLLRSTMDVLTMMASVEPKPGRPYLKQGPKTYGDVTGIMGLAGPSGFQGSFSISFSKAAVLFVVSSMFGGEEFTELDDEIRDAVGEVTNMVSGSARAALADKGYHFDMAIPTVICKEQHSITQVTQAPVVVIPFTCDAGPFHAEVAVWRAAS